MSIPIEEAPAGAHAAQPLDPRSVSHGRAIGAVVTAIIGFVLLLAALIVIVAVDSLDRRGGLLVVLAALMVTAAIGWFAWKWPAVEHKHISYRIDPGGIEIRRGVWWRRIIHVPRSRVQHTDVSQGPIERNFGLATLHVFTAGTDHAEVALGGLSHETAITLRDHLLAGTDEDVV
jgi:membrane protein YdbS with pleckstrin-like domain